MTKGKSSSKPTDHRVVTYPSLIYCKLLTADAYCISESRARIAEDIIKTHYDKMDSMRRDKLLKVYEKMTPEERKHPKQIRQE